MDSTREQIIEIDESISQSEFEVALEWIGKLPQDNASIAISLPRVKDATRHAGNVMINLNRSQSLLWEPQEGILFSRTTTSDSTESSANNFYLQDSSLVLKCRIAKEQSLPAIRADHRLQIMSDRIFLTTVIEFKEDVRSLPLLQWEGKGWSLINAIVLSSGKPLGGNQQPKLGDETSVLPIPIADLNDNPESGSPPTNADVVIGKRVLIQCAKSVSIESSPSGEVSQPTDIDLSVPTISWLDETTQSRRVWSPSGVARFESSIFQISNRSSDLASLPALNASAASSSSLVDSLSNDSRVSPLAKIVPRSSITSFSRGEQTLQEWKISVLPLQPEIESNETIRIMTGRGINGFGQEWLLKSKGYFLIAFYSHCQKNGESLSANRLMLKVAIRLLSLSR